MSQVRLLIDEDAAESALVEALRHHGIDVHTVSEGGRGGETDVALLSFAASAGRVLYTLNVGDFARLHQAFLAASRPHAGIIVIPRQRYSVGEKIRRLFDFINGASSEDLQNTLTFL